MQSKRSDLGFCKISPHGKWISDEDMLRIFESYGAVRESIFRRHELNHVIEFTKGVGVDLGCGLNKIHSAAIGVDKRLSDLDYGYPFGANIRADVHRLPWFCDGSLDFVFSSHCLEHLERPFEALCEWSRKLKKGGYLILILPHPMHYPHIGSKGANPDHKYEFMPHDVLRMLKDIGEFEVISVDTLREKLKDDPWATAEAPKYGHKTLNFSYEIIAKKR